MNGPALFALFPEIPLPRAFALADVSPAPLSDALRFILSSGETDTIPLTERTGAEFLCPTPPTLQQVSGLGLRHTAAAVTSSLCRRGLPGSRDKQNHFCTQD